MKLFLISLSLMFTAIADDRPNVLFILTDDQNTDTVGCYNPEMVTPHIDSLAKNGIKFTQGLSVSTICSPSRYNILTGRYYNNCQNPEFLHLYPSGETSSVTNNIGLEEDGTNVASVLQKNGYRTGFVGKFHLSDHEIIKSTRGWEEAGLQTYSATDHPSSPNISSKMKQNHQWWQNRISKFGFDYVNGVYAANTRELFNDHTKGHNVEWTVKHALNFLDKQQANKEPFFLFFSTTINHGPAPAAVRNGKYIYSLDNDPAITGEGYLKEDYSFMPPRSSFKNPKIKNGQDIKGSIQWWDAGVGAILQKLKDLDLEENTLIIYTADHGLRDGGKTTLYEKGCHVPLLMQWKKKIKEPRTYTNIMGSIDYVPTILDICQAKIPENMKMDGVSYKSVLEGSERPVRESLLLEMGYARAIRTNTHKYIAVRYPEDIEKQIASGKKFKGFKGDALMDQPYLILHKQLAQKASAKTPLYFERNQLFNLKNDPTEQKNIFSQTPEKAVEMQKIMKAVIKKKFPHRPFGEFSE